MKVVWSPLALQKLGDEAEFISLDNPSAAEKWVNEVFNKTELLGSMSEMGRFVPEIPILSIVKSFLVTIVLSTA
ncbi:type II toxin-antitoxin system RelE/ParE family toxin [Marinomonas gallaica]|uniref:type II toxin-antitoxin system RelE/ParE family toxin n=1 Tax=Marinomonas gallaica TaxID=1806667 RepID=UPI000AF0C3BE|nr:type II toxin-antitoxin system RelE/ParE family toxin [Marinomonas gallaica]